MSFLISNIESYVINSFGDNQTDIIHLQRTAYWIKQLASTADEALLIAAISHDIERAFRKKSTIENNRSSKSFLDEEDLRHHQEEGAAIIARHLVILNARDELMKKVVRLISRHEIGGYSDENLLKDADSLSFFENNINFFIESMTKRRTIESIHEKFEWMFSRITTPFAKETALPWYKEAMRRLENCN